MITLQKYQELSKRTFNDLGSYDKNRQHVILGIISEIGELADAYKKHLAYGKELDKINVLEEWADCMFYITNYFTLHKVTIPNPNESWLLEEYLDEENSNEKYIIKNPSDLLFVIVTELNLYPNDDKLINNMFAMGFQLGFTTEELYQALQNNVDKLMIRFPEKFSIKDCNNRNLELERKELEK
jgi:NTP pyrophosphatase (non-canonical NTP hydrolase)